MKKFFLRAMKYKDLEAVHKLEYELFPNPWPKSFFESDLAKNDTIALVACNEANIIGYALANFISPELHITNIAVAPEYQRQGIAQSLMAEIERMAKTKGCRFACLEVRVNNTAAVNLYKKIGYRILYIRKNYYLDGTDAYVMGKELEEEKEVL